MTRRRLEKLVRPACIATLALVLALPWVPRRAQGAFRPFFGPGETLVYEVSYGFVDTGRARITVGAEAEIGQSTVWPIVVQARTNPAFNGVYPIRDRFVTWWHPEEARTLGFDFHASEGDHREHTRARLDPESGRAQVERRKPGEKKPRKRTYEVGPAAHDVTSAVFWLRTRDLDPGDVERVRLFTGSKAWDLVATVEGRERIETAAGTYETVRLRLQTAFDGKVAAKRDIRVWMTDDGAHVPVRIQAELVVGSLDAELATYLPGTRRAR